jgi:predicted AAA+ superfamily ATPase
VGKTTLLLQRLKRLRLPASEALYIDLGDIYFSEHRLLDTIITFIEGGGRYLFIDEVHRYSYDTWAQEIKQAYDLYRQRLKITFTGSSAIQILRQKADLSRRALQYRIPGLSFREYLLLQEDQSLPILSLTDLLQQHRQISRDLLERDFQPLVHLREYWRKGYYPFFLEEPEGYSSRLNTIVQLVLESDIPNIIESGNADYRSLGRLLYAVASSAPFKPNVSKLASRLSIGRNTVLTYLDLLERADLINSLRHAAKGVASLAKPDKIYLNNPNLMYTLAPKEVNIGTIRETFFLNQLNYLTYAPGLLAPEIGLPERGDFLLLDKESRYLFEVGGADKTVAQIGKEEGHFAVIDAENSGAADRIPLWLFGLFY